MEPDTRFIAIWKNDLWRLAAPWFVTLMMVAFLLMFVFFIPLDDWRRLITPFCVMLLGPLFMVLLPIQTYGSVNPRNWVGDGTGWKLKFKLDRDQDYAAIRDWCKETCKGRWNLRVIDRIGIMSFHGCHGIAYFSSKRDTAAFRLFFDAVEER